jgi:hypothetical protein
MAIKRCDRVHGNQHFGFVSRMRITMSNALPRDGGETPPHPLWRMSTGCDIDTLIGRYVHDWTLGESQTVTLAVPKMGA